MATRNVEENIKVSIEKSCEGKDLINYISEQIQSGEVVPYIGPAALDGVLDTVSDEQIPATSESLILAMNRGQPMAPRLMYEFPRAAMNLELKKGRKFVENFLVETYSEKKWNESPFHRWIANIKALYVIDINRDTQLQTLYSDREYLLIVGTARVTGTDFRFRIYHHNQGEYREIEQSEVNSELPILFKPMGTPEPTPSFIAADADYVDYITELMSGFAIPSFLKLRRKGKRYAIMGVPLDRDTERMVLSDIIYGAAEPCGWVFNDKFNDKETRFCSRKNLDTVAAPCSVFINDDTKSESAVA